MTLTENRLAPTDGTNALAATIDFSTRGFLQRAIPVEAARPPVGESPPGAVIVLSSRRFANSSPRLS